MTREDALMAMNGATLIGVADKLGVKAACNKTRTALKEAKGKVIARILEAEAALAAKEASAEEPKTEEPTAEPTQEAPAEETTAVEAPAEDTKEAHAEEEAAAVEAPAEETKETPAEPAPAKPEKKAKAEKKEKKAPEPVAESAEVTAAITALDDIFDKLNGLYFDDLLPKAAITVRRTTRVYDCCSVKKGEAEGQYDIEMCAGAIGKPIEETAASLLHAMVHLYCMEMDIAETCQKGRYHNGKFKKECEDRNLIVEYDSANGFVHTLSSEAFAGRLKTAGIDLDMTLAAIPAKKKGTERA